MSSNVDNEEYDPVANLHMQPAKGILKSAKSIDDAKQDVIHETNSSPTGMTRSESKSHKIPHFDEMNIIATYHPVDKDYGHMKIEEPKTPYAPNDIIDEEIITEPTTTTGIDPNTLTQLLNESTDPSPPTSRFSNDRLTRRSIDDGSDPSSEDSEHRKNFENHRKKHYNEFEIVRLRKKEIEDELRALEQEELKESTNESQGKGTETIFSPRLSVDSIKPILVHHHSKDSSGHPHHHHHVHVEDDHDDDQILTPEEGERKKQFELKRKNHYNEFRAARLADKEDDEPSTTG